MAPRTPSGRPAHGQRPVAWTDAAVATAVYALGLAELGGVIPGTAFPGNRGLHLLLLTMTCIALVGRRRIPLTTFVAVAVVTGVWQYALYDIDQQPPLSTFIAILVAAFGAGAHTSGRRRSAAVAVLAIGVAFSVADLVAGAPLGTAVPPLVTIIGVFGLGWLVAGYRRRAAFAAEEAARVTLESAHAQQEAVAAERARIARELHDVISHDVSLMVLQAAVERREHPDGPGVGVFERIEATGREALAELRRMLGVLRTDDSGAPLAPQPGLAEIRDLVERARESGLDVRLVEHGTDDGIDDPRPLPAGVALTAYRVVQEGLTNVTKHAAPTTVLVELARECDSLVVRVADQGPARPRVPTGGGHGLVGMRERVHLYGGTLQAGPHGIGYRVTARLPLAPEPTLVEER